MSKPKPPWVETNGIMLRANFSQRKVRLAQIWAAKHRPCSRCKAPPYSPCRNLADMAKSPDKNARINKFPHSERIDFDKLKKALNDRGFK